MDNQKSQEWLRLFAGDFIRIQIAFFIIRSMHEQFLYGIHEHYYEWQLLYISYFLGLQRFLSHNDGLHVP